MELIEVVQGDHTSEETIKMLMDFAVKIGKAPVWLRKEIDGFIVNRILRAISNESFYLVEQGISSPQEIDRALEKGANHPMGPFRLADLVGIDVTYLIKNRAYEQTGEKPLGLDLLAEKVKKGELGRKHRERFLRLY
jgi:3-hydroxybutyryl-CoA dehydrogenase